MAKKEEQKINKSQAIREVIGDDLSMSPAQVVSLLAQRGVEVADGLVAQVKTAMKKKLAPPTISKRLMPAPAQPINGDFIATLEDIKRIADKVGGFDQLSKIAETLSK